MKNNTINYYNNARYDLLPFIPNNVNKILEIGCGTGSTGEAIKLHFDRKIEVVGVEYNIDMAEIAKGKIDNVIIGNIENLDLPYQSNYFDCIIYADVLEHLIDPWKLLKDHFSLLSEDGCIIASIPNIANYKIIRMLKKGLWDYKDAGIMDKTHLRFFTKKTVLELFNQAGLKPEIVGKSLSKNNFWVLIDKIFNSNKSVIQFFIKAKK